MKLNLGCGDDLREGYTNVDFRKTHPDVMQVDLSVFPWPFEDESVDEVMMLDFLEHFPYRQTEQILLECFRILQWKGTLIIQVPDGVHLAAALGGLGVYLCNRCGNEMRQRDESCSQCDQSADDIADAAVGRLFGGQDYPGNWHQTVFTQRSLRLKAERNGFLLSSWQEIDHQYANWNFKGKFVKIGIRW